MRHKVSTTVRRRTFTGSKSTTYGYNRRPSRTPRRSLAEQAAHEAQGREYLRVLAAWVVAAARWLSRLEWTWQRVVLVVAALFATGLPTAICLLLWVGAFFAWRKLGPQPAPQPLPPPAPAGTSWCDFCADWTTHPTGQHH